MSRSWEDRSRDRRDQSYRDRDQSYYRDRDQPDYRDKDRNRDRDWDQSSFRDRDQSDYRDRDRNRDQQHYRDKDPSHRDKDPSDYRDRSRERRSRDRRDRSQNDDRSKKENKAEPEDDETLRPGSHVTVKGLKSNPEKNGSFGELVEFNKEKGRWVVKLSTGGNFNFKEENLQLMPDNSDVVKDDEEPPTAKIYITGLAAETTDQDLIKLFGGVGMIAKEAPKTEGRKGFADQWPYAVKLYKPGRRDGDGCVTYMDPQAAKAAIKNFNRFRFMGAKLSVSYAGQGRKYEAVELQKPWHLREENRGRLDREVLGKGGAPSDWTCPDCGVDVFDYNKTCYKCGAPKPDKKGKDSGKGSRAGPWTCPDCGADVYASKETCYKCGASKPSDAGGGGESKGGGGQGKGKGRDW